MVQQGFWCNKDCPTGGLEIPCPLTFEGTCGKIQAMKEDYKTMEALAQVEDIDLQYNLHRNVHRGHQINCYDVGFSCGQGVHPSLAR